MKLPNFYDLEPLNRLKERMGIPRNVYGSLGVKIAAGRLTEKELDALTSGDGIDVNFTELTIIGDGTLAYKNSRVLVYIRDVHVFGESYNLPRYHFYNCSTLKSMHEGGRFERYVISATHDVTFSVNIISNNRPSSRKTRLDACRNCLNELHINGFDSQRMVEKKKAQFVAEFTPSHFFELYPQSLFVAQPAYDSDTAPPGIYAPDWPQTSERARNEAGWRCQECRRDLSARNRRRFLQTHHKNGNRNDNSRTNLLVLCIACHASQPRHHHIRSSPDYLEFVNGDSPR